MARASSGVTYPDRFHAAAEYAGFGGSSDPASASNDGETISRFRKDTALLLYGLYQQATVGRCTAPKPQARNAVEHSKWASWNGLGSMARAEAMRLFVKILEEEDPAWHSRVPETIMETVTDLSMNKSEHDLSKAPNENIGTETKTIPLLNGGLVETQDKNVISEGLSSVSIYDQWVSPTTSGQPPKPRYQHGAAVVQEKMYIFGGNHNGRYLGDLQVLDLKSLKWSRVETKASASQEGSIKAPLVPCAGHSFVSWGNKILSLAGHTKDPSETITVREFDPSTSTWSNLRTYGQAPISRGGQSVTLVGATLVMFGGEDAKRSLLNDLHILDLETLTWEEIDAVGIPPSPRSDHTAAVHAERYLLIFGGGSHATCFSDLHVLDLQTMEWSQPSQQGILPTPRSGHAGVTIGENWFIVGGGNNEDGVSETLVLNMSTLVWSVVITSQGRVPIASEGLSLVICSLGEEDVLVSFGGYNGRYNNEVNVLKPSNKSAVQSTMIREPASDSVSALLPTSVAPRDMEPGSETSQWSKVREIIVDHADAKSETKTTDEGTLGALRAEKAELEAAVSKEKLETHRLRQEILDAGTRSTSLTKELQSVRGLLATEQSRCFKLEVDVAELRQKLQTMDTLQKELELLQRQRAVSEQAALNTKQRQSSSGVWGWLAGNPQDSDSDF